MKPPNHGREHFVSDPFLILKGHTLYTPQNIDGFRLGLSIRTLDGIEPLVIGDRIEVIP